MPLTDDDVQMLTALTVRCRPHGASRWDPAGTAAFIRKVANRPLPSVMRACAAAAADRNNRTPAVIPQPGAHWRESDSDIPFVAPSLAELCGDCGREQGPQHPQDHPWVSLRSPRPPAGYDDGPARARAALAKLRSKAGIASGDQAEAGSPS